MFQAPKLGFGKVHSRQRDLAVKRALFPQNRFDRAPKILSKKSGDLSNPDCENCAVKNRPMVQKYTFPVHVRENQNAMYRDRFYSKAYLQTSPLPSTCSTID